MNQQQLEYQRDLYLLLLEMNKEHRGIDFVLSKALELVIKITCARIGYIELRNNRGKCWWSTYHCTDVDIDTIRHRISSGIIAEAIQTGETIVTPSAFLDSRFSERESVREERIEAVLCSPFIGDGTIGVIYLQGDQGTDFDTDHCMMETDLFKRHITPLLHRLHYQLKVRSTKPGIRKKYNISNIIGDSSLFLKKLQEAMAIAELDVTVLITGETGTGKGVLAKSIHNNSVRKYKPFVHLNCANLPEQLAESELFGASKGSHSGAYTDIQGKIAAAKGGTLFLDEIGVLSICVQAKLLQFLEEGYYYSLGSNICFEADVRIIAAANIDFTKAISKGTFREDLYYRLSVFPIELPSLQKRKEDIPVLFRFFMEKYCRKYSMPILEPSPSVLTAFEESEWSGNIRQMENVIQQGILRARAFNSQTITINHFLPGQTRQDPPGIPATYRESKDDWERRFIARQLEKHLWNISETAKTLELSRSHLNNLIKIHKLEWKTLHKVN